jgi:hypothetical protein
MTAFTPVPASDNHQTHVWHWLLPWAALRVWASLCAVWASELRPMQPLEQSVPIWPPAAPLSQWLHRALLSPWERWDVVWYLRILNDGYRPGNGTDAFHPLFPLLARPLTYLGIEPLLALMMVALVAFFAFVPVFQRLAALDLSPSQVQTATLLLLFFPVGFILFAPYNEGLFLLFAALTLWWARRRKWWWAGGAGALAVLTRQQGVLLFLPLGWELWEAHGKRVRDTVRDWRSWMALGLIPGGLVLWGLYRVLAVGGTQLDFSSPYALAYSMIISPSAGEVGAAHVLTWPWHALWLALVRAWAIPDPDLVVNLLLAEPSSSP